MTTTHSRTCDCVTCHKDGRAAMVALSNGDYTQYEEHLHRYHASRGTLRTAARGESTLRTNVHHSEANTMLSPDDQTLTMAIANALHDLGVPATPQKTERGVRIAKRALEGANRSGTDVRALSEFEPPNPYDLPLKALRGSNAVQPVRQVTPSADCTPPDPYADGLKAMRAQEPR